MILDAIIGFFLAAFRAVVGLLPTWSPDTSAFSTMSTSIGSAASSANGYFPVSVLGWCLVLILGVKVALLAWRVVLFVYELIPFKMT